MGHIENGQTHIAALAQKHLRHSNRHEASELPVGNGTGHTATVASGRRRIIGRYVLGPATHIRRGLDRPGPRLRTAVLLPLHRQRPGQNQVL